MRGAMLILLAGLISFALVMPATVSADVEDEMEEINERLDDLELKTAKNKISFYGDFRVRYDYMKWHIPAYNQFMGMDVSNPSAPAPVYAPIPAQDLENNEAWSARLRLKMDAKIGKEVHFTGRLNMNRGYGASPVPIFNGFPNTVLHAFNSTAIPVDNRLMVERAAFTWDPEEVPLFFTLGRQAATNGPPRELRENSVRQGTPGALMIDAEIDGVMVGIHLAEVTGLPDDAILRICYGHGFESGFGSGGAASQTYVTTYAPNAADGSLMPTLHVIGELEDSKVIGACGESSIPGIRGSLVTAGFYRMLNMTDIPAGFTRGFPNPLSTQDQFLTATTNLGDMDLFGVCFQHAADIDGYKLDWFASYAGNKSHPDEGTASAYGFGPMLGNDMEDLSGYAVYFGARGDVPPTGGKLGFEYNHGDENWFAYLPAADDVNSKLSTRGDVFEGYYIQPLTDNLDLRLGYQHYDYSHAFSGWHISPAPIEMFDLETEPFLPYPYPDTIKNLYVVVDLNF
jgi:hypothetical protein